MVAMSLSSRKGPANNRARTTSIAKYIRISMIILFFGIIAVQFWVILRYANEAKQNDIVAGAVMSTSDGKGAMTIPPRPSETSTNKNNTKRNDVVVAGMSMSKSKSIIITPSPSPQEAETPNSENEYIMWKKEEAYMRNCELHIKGNETWGKSHAPFVDKIEAKNIVERMNVPSLKIIPTLAVLDKNNITTAYSLEFMKSLKQPYIIKGTHLSGGVARVYDNKYHCFKFCSIERVMPLDETAFKVSNMQLMRDLYIDYSKNGAEMQYRYITPRIIFEEDVISSGKTDTDVTYWWLSHGHPIFVSEQCQQLSENKLGTQMKRIFLGTDFRKLPILLNRGTCQDLPEKSKSWNTQLEIATELGKNFPGEVVRIDFYGGGDDVWFSELTFTTLGCWRKFNPMLTDGLLYGLMKEEISPDIVTPAYLERVLNDRSWVAVSMDSSRISGSYPSPVDLCINFEDLSDEKETKKRLFDSCIDHLRTIQESSLRCLIVAKNGTELHSFGANAPVKSTLNYEACASTYRMNLGVNQFTQHNIS